MIRDLVTAWLEKLVFANRRLLIVLFVLVTAFMAFSASRLRIDAGFTKQLPLEHEYMKTFVQHQQEFGGANRVLIALSARQGDIFTAEYFDALRQVTDDVFFIPGVDRSLVSSLFTPNTRFTEVVEDGISGGNVVPSNFQPTPEGLETVRRNILKSGIVGRLVANDFSAAIVSAELMEVDPTTGERLDYIAAARRFEEIRSRYDAMGDDSPVDVHIIGFAKVIGDVAEGASRVVLFFGIAFLLTALQVFFYSQSFRLSMLPLVCSLAAVVWQLGLLSLLGFGIDPMSILVPFLIFAIGVSHGVQMISAARAEIYQGADALGAAQAAFRRLLLPGGIALLSDTIGFITILLIKIRVIQEMAITASLGVAVIILTNLVLLPVLLSHMNFDDAFRVRMRRRAEHLEPAWAVLSRITGRQTAAAIVAVALVLAGLGAWKAGGIRIGDLHRGVPELRASSRYNVDSEFISTHFSIGVDILTVIAETAPEGCIDHDIMTTLDEFTWHMANVSGVQSVVALPEVAKVISAGWNEGSLKWRVLPRNQSMLVQAVSYVPTSSGLLNADCSVMPVMVFTSDHKAETIDRAVAAVKEFERFHGREDLRLRLATGNVGVMAATNEAVRGAQYPMLVWVFSAILVLCLITFRSVRGTLCVVLPLGLVSLLAYALMAMLEIGLKVNTLPVVALGVGIGVDYGIYIYSRLQSFLAQGLQLREAYWETLRVTGNGVLFTGVTLATGVATWLFSPLKFQADMGLLLVFMFAVNMLGAILLLPALAAWLLPKSRRNV